MKSLFERMGGTYRWEGDYLIPDLVLPNIGTYHLGKYGRMHCRYLQEHRPATYAALLISGKLVEHLSEIDQTCRKRIEHICSVMAQQEGATETLKVSYPMEWVRRMNSILSCAEEIICAELIYTEDGRVQR